MARPVKTGMDYFPHDVDASSDEKIEALRELHGNDGYAFYFILLERIYRTENAELDLSKEINLKIVAGKVKVSMESFIKMINTSLEIDCFDRKEYETRKVITSQGIKKRFNEVVSMRERWKSKKKQKNTSEFSQGKTTEETGEIKEKKIKEKNIAYLPLSEFLKEKIIQSGTSGIIKDSQLTSWSNDFRLMVERDGRTEAQVQGIIEAVFKDSFWSKNIRSAEKLREQWNTGKLDRIKPDAVNVKEPEYQPQYFRKLNP